LDTKEVMIANSATEDLVTLTIKSKLNCHTLAWNSHSQFACGYDDGTIEIHQIESRNRRLKSKMVQKIRHDLGEHGQVSLLVLTLTDFVNFPNKILSYVTSIAWNEELSLLASGGTDQRIKVFS
jgi:transducin (beta)-like 1